MTGKFLVDTNVLVYAYDRSSDEKRRRAAGILQSLAETDSGMLSTQILSEFFVVVTKKIKPPLTVNEAYFSVSNYIHSWNVTNISTFILLEAIRGVQVHNFSYFDSLVWATARMNQIATVLSEDFASGSIVDGVRFINPFKQKISIF
jgi:predicted nucleic acid-binding protein